MIEVTKLAMAVEQLEDSLKAYFGGRYHSAIVLAGAAEQLFAGYVLIDLSLMDDTLAVIARPTHRLVIARPQAAAIHRRSSAAMDCRAALAMTGMLS